MRDNQIACFGIVFQWSVMLLIIDYYARDDDIARYTAIIYTLILNDTMFQ